MAKSEYIIPSWLGGVEFRTYKNRRDFYESVNLRWIVNEPHDKTINQLKQLYIVEQEPNKYAFTVVGLTELGKQMLQIKQQLNDTLVGSSRIIFQ